MFGVNGEPIIDYEIIILLKYLTHINDKNYNLITN